MPYDRLVIATGARARVLPVLADRPEALALRTATDSRRLAAAVRCRRRIAVVGGFIGLGFRCGATVAAAGPAPDGGVRLDLTDSSVVDADAVLVGVGMLRDVALLALAGLETADGLVCDAHGRTSHPDVFGVGDLEGTSFVAQFHTDGRPGGVLAVNDPRQFLRHRRALQQEPAG